jgi:hypothetical protein
MSERMDKLKAKFADPQLRAALLAFAGVTDQHKCNELHQNVERIIGLGGDDDFWCDEGYGYPGGCNNYLVEQWQGDVRLLQADEGGSCEYDYFNGELTLGIHDPAGHVIETHREAIA